MSLPIAVAMPSVREPASGTTASRAFRAAAVPGETPGGFEMTLGAMITPATVRRPPAEAPVELVLDGEWRLDLEQPSDETCSVTGAPAVIDHAPAADEEVVVPLGKSLESWLAAVGRRSAPVPTEVRHGAAEEMVDLVPPQAASGLPTDVVGPAVAMRLEASTSSGAEELSPAVPMTAEAPTAPGTTNRSTVIDSAGTVTEELPHGGHDLRTGWSNGGAPEPEVTRADESVTVADTFGLTGTASSNAWLGASAAPGSPGAGVYRDRLIDAEGSDAEPAQAEPHARLDRSTVRSPVSNQGWGEPRGSGMDQLLDEGLDPEALLARYEARHPAVEIGGFAFPLDGFETVADEGAPNRAGRSRTESAEVTAYERLRSQGLAGDQLTGSGRDADRQGSGRESGGSAAEHRAAVATRALGEVRPPNPPGSVAEPVKAAPRSDTAEVMLPAALPAASLPAEGERSEAGAVARPAQPAAAADPADRIARRVEHLMLNIADDQGDYGRLKVSVAGTSVRATILPNDPVLAERLTVDLRQLRQQLGDRGFAEAAVTVQAPRAADNAVASPALVVRDVVDMPGFDNRTLDRSRAEDQRRETPRDPREQNREDERPSHRSRDQRQNKRGGQE